MARALIAALMTAALLIAALPRPVEAQARPKPEEPGVELGLRYEYVNRESAAELAAYHRVAVMYNTGNRLLNPRAGVELRFDDSQLRTYWIGNDFEIYKRATVHLRLNHTEYEDWGTSINYLNAYISYQIWWFRLAIGLGYAAVNFEPRNIANPLEFNSPTPETRFIYNLSIHPVMWDGRIEADLGMKSYNDFEYQGFDDTGFHAELIWNIGPQTSASVLYQRRYSAVFISVPTVNRITWVFAIEQRF